MEQIRTSTPFCGYIDSNRGGRSENQDTCGFVDTAIGLLVVVCDGMGGGPAGKLASSIAVDTIIHVVCQARITDDRKAVVDYAIKEANTALLAKQKESQTFRGMGTTVTVLLINEYSAIVSHVGDSRVYQLRRGFKKYRTEDHSQVGELVRSGVLTEEQARISPQSNVITRALGVKSEVVPEVMELPYEEDDRFVLCTDGIWGAMPEKELIKIMASTKSPSGTVEKTMILVNEIGVEDGNHHDNFTMALIVATKNSKMKEPMTRKTRNLMLCLIVLCGLSILGNIILLSSAKKKDTPDKIVNNTLFSDSLVNAKINERMAEYGDSLSQLHKEEIAKLQSEWREQLRDLNKKVDENSRKHIEKEEKELDILAKIDSIVDLLEKLRGMKAGKTKNNEVEHAKDEVALLCNEIEKSEIKDSKNISDNIRKSILAKLNNSIAKDDDRNRKTGATSKAHYNILIRELKEIKETIKK